MQTAFNQIRTTLESFVTPEARLAASAALLVVAAAFALVVVPWAVTQVTRLLQRGASRRESVPLSADDVSRFVPTSVGARVLQGITLLALGFALLLIWGYVSLALWLASAVAGLLPTLGRTVVTILLFAGALLGTDLLESRLEAYAEESDYLNEHQKGIVFRVLQLTLLIAVALATLTIWNYNLDGLLVGAGFLGIVVGMAARQTLGSLIAGFVLMFSRPFEIGDWVVIDDNDGMVTDITIINTRLRNFDGETIVIPNDQANNSTVINRTDRDRLRLRLDVGIDYEADLERAEALAEEALEGLEESRRVPAPQVIPKAFGDSAMGLELRFWIDNPSARRRWRAHAAAVRAIKAAFDDAGIDIPYPQRELSGREGFGGFRTTDEGATASDAAVDDGAASGDSAGNGSGTTSGDGD